MSGVATDAIEPAFSEAMQLLQLFRFLETQHLQFSSAILTCLRSRERIAEMQDGGWGRSGCAAAQPRGGLSDSMKNVSKPEFKIWF